MQMMAVAVRMARTGDYANAAEIEADLTSLGFKWADYLLRNPAERTRLDRICAAIRAPSAAAE